MARGQPSQVRLQFKQALRGCSNAELQKRLRALHEELAEIDQELIVTSSLDTVAKDLINHSLLLHKEKGIKAYLACCLADVLRLYAPEAPYTEPEIKDIFTFFIRQLKHLTTPADPHFAEYFYLIESLSNVKSVCLICDLDGGDELMKDMFATCFDVISSASPKNVEICLADILLQLLEEATTLTTEVVDTLLAQFLPSSVKKRPAAFRLAVDVCTGGSDKLQRYVCQYFAEQIMSEIEGTGERSEDEDTASEDGKRKGKKGGIPTLPQAFITAHSLIRQINRSVPSLLTNVIPQLEEELVTDKGPEYRKLATEVLGQMLGEKMGQGDLAAKYPATWKNWLARGRDKAVVVRVAMTEALGKIWSEHPELVADIEATVLKVLRDPDDKVRLAACTIFEEIDYETTSHHVPKSVLVALSERCRDRKNAVRSVSFKSLGRLYNLAFSEIESRDERAIEQFAWIPASVLENIKFVADPSMVPSLRYAIMSSLLTYIVPSPKKEDDDAAWVDRFLLMMRYLNQDQTATVLSLTRLAETRPNMFDAFITACEQNNGGIIDNDATKIKDFLKMTVRAISAQSPDPNKTTEDLNRFAKANEKQLYKLIRTLLDPQTDLKTQLKNYKETLRRVEQISTTILETFIFFLRNSVFLLINRSSIPTLLKRVQGGRSGADAESQAHKATIVLNYISKHQPALYKSHVAELTKALQGEGKEESVVETALHAASKLCKGDRTTNVDKKLSDRAKHFARSGTVNQAKYAATIIALDEAKPGVADDLVEFLADELPEVSDEDLAPRLSALARLALHARDSFERKSEQITKSVLEILNREAAAGEILEHEDNWVEDEKLDPLALARVLAVKVLTNRCLAYADTEEASKVAQPVFQLLWPLLRPHEDHTLYSPSTSSRLRLAAALSVLKLAASPAFQNSISERFELFARTAQDECFEVRVGFIDKLLSYLRSNRIVLPRYNMVLFLVAHDPEEELRLKVVHYVSARAKKVSPDVRQRILEQPLLRLIHLLAHHPDFEGTDHDDEDIATMSKYLEMYIDCLATSENIPYLYHLALKIKTVRDKEDASYDTNLYILSELAQHLLKLRARSEGWALSANPYSTTLPSDIFKPLPSKETAKKVSDTAYLTDDLIGKITYSGAKSKAIKVKTNGTAQKRKSPKPRAPRSGSTKPKRASASKKKKKTNGYASDDSSDPPSDDSLDSDDELDSDGEPKSKKLKAAATKSSPAKPRPESSRKGLRSDPKAKVEEGMNDGQATRGGKAKKGLNKPREMKLGKGAELVSDLEEDEEEEEEKEEEGSEKMDED